MSPILTHSVKRGVLASGSGLPCTGRTQCVPSVTHWAKALTAVALHATQTAPSEIA